MYQLEVTQTAFCYAWRNESDRNKKDQTLDESFPTSFFYYCNSTGVKQIKSTEFQNTSIFQVPESLACFSLRKSS